MWSSTSRLLGTASWWLTIPVLANSSNAVLADIESHYQDSFHPGPEVLKDGALFTRNEPRRGQYYWDRILNAWKIEPSVRAMALDPRVLSIVEDLFGRRPLPYQTLNFPVGTQQSEHIDAFIFNSDPPRFMCGVWIALEDMDLDNGPLMYYPGSHKLPVPEMDQIEREMNVHLAESDYGSKRDLVFARYDLFSRYCLQMIERHGFKRELATIRKGQALIWAANLIHGGAPQNDMSRTRHSQVTHYFFEGCRVYSPELADPDGRFFWQYPEWIRDPPAAAQWRNSSRWSKSMFPRRRPC